MPVSQIGVQVPVVVSFLIVPVVLLFLHAYTLIWYDMLTANLWQLGTDLQALARYMAASAHRIEGNHMRFAAGKKEGDVTGYPQEWAF
jgi:hypothetical protein